MGSLQDMFIGSVFAGTEAAGDFLRILSLRTIRKLKFRTAKAEVTDNWSARSYTLQENLSKGT